MSGQVNLHLVEFSKKNEQIVTGSHNCKHIPSLLFQSINDKSLVLSLQIDAGNNGDSKSPFVKPVKHHEANPPLKEDSIIRAVNLDTVADTCVKKPAKHTLRDSVLADVKKTLKEAFTVECKLD